MIINWETGPYVEIDRTEEESQDALMMALKIGNDVTPWTGKVIDRKGKMKRYLPKEKIAIELRNYFPDGNMLITIGIPDQNPKFGNPISPDKLVSFSSNARAHMSIEEQSFMNLSIIEAIAVFKKLQERR